MNNNSNDIQQFLSNINSSMGIEQKIQYLSYLYEVSDPILFSQYFNHFINTFSSNSEQPFSISLYYWVIKCSKKLLDALIDQQKFNEAEEFIIFISAYIKILFEYSMDNIQKNNFQNFDQFFESAQICSALFSQIITILKQYNLKKYLSNNEIINIMFDVWMGIINNHHHIQKTISTNEISTTCLINNYNLEQEYSTTKDDILFFFIFINQNISNLSSNYIINCCQFLPKFCSISWSRIHEEPDFSLMNLCWKVSKIFFEYLAFNNQQLILENFFSLVFKNLQECLQKAFNTILDNQLQIIFRFFLGNLFSLIKIQPTLFSPFFSSFMLFYFQFRKLYLCSLSNSNPNHEIQTIFIVIIENFINSFLEKSDITESDKWLLISQLNPSNISISDPYLSGSMLLSLLPVILYLPNFSPSIQEKIIQESVCWVNQLIINSYYFLCHSSFHSFYQSIGYSSLFQYIFFSFCYSLEYSHPNHFLYFEKNLFFNIFQPHVICSELNNNFWCHIFKRCEEKVRQNHIKILLKILTIGVNELFQENILSIFLKLWPYLSHLHQKSLFIEYITPTCLQNISPFTTFLCSFPIISQADSDIQEQLVKSSFHQLSKYNNPNSITTTHLKFLFCFLERLCSLFHLITNSSNSPTYEKLKRKSIEFLFIYIKSQLILTNEKLMKQFIILSRFLIHSFSIEQLLNLIKNYRNWFQLYPSSRFTILDFIDSISSIVIDNLEYVDLFHDEIIPIFHLILGNPHDWLFFNLGLIFFLKYSQKTNYLDKLNSLVPESVRNDVINFLSQKHQSLPPLLNSTISEEIDYWNLLHQGQTNRLKILSENNNYLQKEAQQVITKLQENLSWLQKNLKHFSNTTNDSFFQSMLNINQQWNTIFTPLNIKS